ncbi:hypothetical protein ES705_04518 [subsurface metagenome]
MFSCTLSGLIFFITSASLRISSEPSLIPLTSNTSNQILFLNSFRNSINPSIISSIFKDGCGRLRDSKRDRLTTSREGITTSASLNSPRTSSLLRRELLVTIATGISVSFFTSFIISPILEFKVGSPEPEKVI